MLHFPFLRHPRLMDNHSHRTLHTLNPISDFLTRADLRNPSSGHHTLSPNHYTFSHAHPNKVLGLSTNCLSCLTLNPTLYLRDQ